MGPYLQESEAEVADAEEGEMHGLLEQEDHLGNSQPVFLAKLTLFLMGLKILCEGLLGTAGKLVAMLLLALAGKRASNVKCTICLLQNKLIVM